MNEKIRDLMFSSRDKEWRTPQSFFDKLNKIHGPYTLDPCCTRASKKCLRHYTAEDDGLSKSWQGHNVFMNPPYGRDIGKWLKKAYEESRDPGTLVTCLIPARTDTKYWHDYCMKAWRIYFVKGRIKFDTADSEGKNAAPFPSAVVVFKGDIRGMGWAGNLVVGTMNND